MPGRERPPVYADEDVDRPLTEALRERGFDVRLHSGERPEGYTESEVRVALALAEA